MRTAILRADGSQRLGIGHIMRCIGFAQGLKKEGIRSVFVVKNFGPEITEVIQKHEYDVNAIDPNSGYEEDASLTLNTARRHNADLIVTDLCHTDTLANLDEYSKYLQALKATHKFLVTIDGLCKIRFPSDIVIDPYYRTENMNYETYGCTKFLLGPAYFIFRQEFIEAAKMSRQIKEDAQNILVTMGGSDPLNVTLKIAKALNRLNKTSVNLWIVVGVCQTDLVKQELERILKCFNGNYELIMRSEKMAELMLWSDVAITAGGLTKYETAVTGTPSIVISQTDHEAEMTKEFERNGTTLHLGLINKVGEEDIVETIEKVLEDYVLRCKMSKRGKNLVDGKGVERINSEISAGLLS